MTGDNLTRDEARERARLLAVSSYDVALDLTDGQGKPGQGTFRSTTTVAFDCVEPGTSTFVDLTAPAVLTVELNGSRLDLATVVEGSRITLPDLAEHNELRVVADCAYMRTGEGLHRFVDPVDGEAYLYTQFETADAHRVYACFDQPDLKAEFRFEIVAPAHWQVVSNAMATRSGDRWTFAPTPRMSTYVTALIAGPYHVERDEHDGIPLGIYCRASLAEHLDAPELFELTRLGFDYYHRVFDYRYPFGKYDQLFVPEFNAGAMENAGAVTFVEDYVFRSKVTQATYERRAETLLHEMAHMWFGDLVTMRWWDDLWLNESFATYMSVLCQVEATRFTNGWTTFANTEKGWAYRQDQLPSTHPVASDMPDLAAVTANFDGITYAKGASVLKQLVAWVGLDEFLGGLRTYFRRHEYGNTEIGDLLRVLEESSGRDLSGWSAQWLETTGVNTLRAAFDVGPDGTFKSFALRQEAPPGHATLRSHRVAIGLYDVSPSGRLARTSRVELDMTGEQTEVPELVGVPRPALVLVNDDDLTYAKIRLDGQSLATVTTHLGALEDSLPRALLWAAVWDMTRDAETPAGDYLALVLAGIGREDDIGVVQSLLRLAESAATMFGDPARRETRLTALADHALGELQAAEPGGDLQLAWARALGSTARTDEHLAALRGLLAGDLSVPGLTVDTDLRWALLRRLVVVGAAGQGEIAAELARDGTAAGQRQAAAALASRPTAQAKEQAWHDVVDSDDLPNATQAAVIGAFASPDQLELLEPYVDRYFSALDGLWASRTPDTAQTLVKGLYPSLLVSQETVERTDRWLADDHPPSLRRLVLEARDGVVRALRARHRDTPGTQLRATG